MGLTERTNRRRFLVCVGGVGAAALLVACGAPAQPTATPAPAKPAAGAAPTVAPAAAPKAAAGVTTLRLHCRLGPEDDMWPQILPKFEQENNAKVELEQVAGQQEYLQKLQTLVAAGQVGDVAHVFTGDSSFQMFFSSGMLVSLEKFVADDKFDLNQYYKFCVDICKVDGKLGGLPFKGHPSRCGIFYNKDLFDAAGIKVPTNDSSYDDLVAAAKKLHKASASGDVDVFGWSNPGKNDLEWYIVLTRAGGATGSDLFIEDGKKSGMQNPDAQWGWKWVYDMMNTHKIMLNPLASNPAPNDLFLSGKLAMLQANLGQKAAYAKLDKFKWGMSIAPKGPKGRRGTMAQADVVALTKYSKAPELGWKLLKAITSKEAGIALGRQSAGGRSATPGGRPDVYEALLDLPMPPGVQENTMLAMKEVEPYIQPANFRGPEIIRAIDPLYEALILDKNKPDSQYFTQLHQAIQDILDKPRP